MNSLHPSFWAALIGWFIAQLIKMISCFLRSGKLDFSYLLSTGGMPSAHSSMACSLAISIGLYEGFSSVSFTIGAAFSAVVMFDAQSVRKAAGEQAKILNQTKPPMEDRLAYITDGLRSGLHPTHLEPDEIITLEDAYGKEWYKKWDYTEADLTQIN